jgi:hypothetical protein
LVTQDTTIAITWRITTDAAHDTGALSTAGEFFDAVTGVRLSALPTSVGTLTGAGPLLYNETIVVAAAQVAQWRAQGIRLVGYRRTFTSRDPPPQSAQLLIDLQGGGLEGAREATSGELRVLRLELAFAGGERIAIVERGATLTARVVIGYSGSGILRGRWEIAEPAGAGEPLFRVLAQVREPMSGEQSRTIESAALPTEISGRYVLRFCAAVDERTPVACEASDTAVQTLYEVTAHDALPVLRGIGPDNRMVDAATLFHWPAVNDVTTYQLQIFRAAEPEPVFVAGMLLDSSVTRTALSDATRGRLGAGQRYLWRITAHDRDGQLLARSDAASFIYQPSAVRESP